VKFPLRLRGLWQGSALTMAVELTEILLAKIAGWDTVKLARSVVSGGRVQSSSWEPPRLTGVVQGGSGPLQTGLIIRDAVNVDNLCSCRTARERGIICEHAVAVGIHWIRSQQAIPIATSKPASTVSATKPVKRLRRAHGGEDGERVAIHVLFPPNFSAAAAKGKVMLCFEAERLGNRSPLNALPLDEPFAFDEADTLLLDVLEPLAGEPAGMVILTTTQLREFLPKLVRHPRVTVGKTQSLEVSSDPLPLRVKAVLQEDGEIHLSLKGEPPTYSRTPSPATTRTLMGTCCW